MRKFKYTLATAFLALLLIVTPLTQVAHASVLDVFKERLEMLSTQLQTFRLNLFNRSINTTNSTSQSSLVLSTTTPTTAHEIWTYPMQSSTGSKDEIDGVSVDSAGNTVFGGPFNDTVTFNGVKHTAKNGNDIFVTKVSPTGKELWFITIDSGGHDYMWDLDTDKNDNVILSGGYGGTLTFGGKTYSAARDGSALFVKLDGRTGKILWIRTAGVIGKTGLIDAAKTAGGNEITVDSKNNYVAILSGSGEKYKIGNSIYYGAGAMDSFIVKITNGGDFSWVYQFQGTGRKQTRAIAVTGPNDDILFGHQLIGTIENTGGTRFTTSSNTVAQGTLGMISTAGKFKWMVPVTSPTGFANVRGAGGDSKGNAYFTGVITGESKLGNVTIKGYPSGSAFLAKYDNTGKFTWARVLDSDKRDEGGELITWNDNRITITGGNQGPGYNLYDRDGMIIKKNLYTRASQYIQPTLTTFSDTGALISTYAPKVIDAGFAGVLDYAGGGCLIVQHSLHGRVTYFNGSTYESTGAGDKDIILVKVCPNALGQVIPTPPPPPVCTSFTATPASIVSGKSSTLAWDTSNATFITITGLTGTLLVDGTRSVSPTTTTTYTLRAFGTVSQAAACLATVTVTPPVTIVSFTAIPASITRGKSSTLIWDTANATFITITGLTEALPADGTRSVSPTTTTTYKLTAFGTGSQTATSSVTVTVTPPPPVCTSFTATPASIVSGKSSTLAWDTSNATFVTITGLTGTLLVDGTRSVSPTTTTTYTLTAVGGGKIATCSATVTVTPPPLIIKPIVGPTLYSIVHGGKTRTFLVHIPTNYNKARTVPLVFLFHGGNGTGQKVINQTQFAIKANAEGFIVIAPDGYKNNWADGRGTTEPDIEGIDDVAFVRALLKVVQGSLLIDSKRIYATGVSNGGLFSERLGCEMSDVLAAIGPVVGPMPQNIAGACKIGSPISVIGIQGTLDPFMPMEGGDTKHKTLGIGNGGLVIGADATMRTWATRNSCPNSSAQITTLPQIVADGTTVTLNSYTNCAANTAINYYIVKGMGHGWPPYGQGGMAGPVSGNINATNVVWEFFKARPKQ